MPRRRTAEVVRRQRAWVLVQRFIAAAGELGSAAEIAWRRRAACRDANPELFFPGAHEERSVPMPTSQNVMIAVAKAICNGSVNPDRDPCPVKWECLAYAMARNERHGIWGGMTFNERNIMRRTAYDTKARAKAPLHAVTSPDVRRTNRATK